jgi:ABC-type multidrug transport system ATPase subunit
MAAILRGFAYLASDAESIFGFSASFVEIGRAKVGAVPVPVIIAGLLYLVGSVVLLRTVYGLRIYAIGGNATSASLTGVRSESIVTSLYALNGALIGVVAALTVARLGSAQPAIGVNFELDVLTAVILGGVAFNGGVGHPLGVLIGVVTIGVIDAGIVFAGVPDFWQQIVRGSVLLLALVGDQVASRQRARSRPAVARQLEAAGTTEPADGAGRPPPDRGEVARAETGQVVMAVKGLAKSYGSVTAVRDVSFSVRAGEVVCLVGDNGAGKSTVIKMMSGAVEPDEGSIELAGRRVDVSSPRAARAAGIETVYQDLALCPNLGASLNFVLGAEPTRTPGGLFALRDDDAADERARRSLGELGIVLTDLSQPVRLLSGGQRQAVAIARAASEDVRVVILDEPTAALGVKQTRNVLDLVRELRRRDVAIVLISHNIETIYEVADRLVVLRLGQVVFDGTPAELPERDLVHLMAGLALERPTPVSTSGVADGA